LVQHADPVAQPQRMGEEQNHTGCQVRQYGPLGDKADSHESQYGSYEEGKILQIDPPYQGNAGKGENIENQIAEVEYDFPVLHVYGTVATKLLYCPFQQVIEGEKNHEQY